MVLEFSKSNLIATRRSPQVHKGDLKMNNFKFNAFLEEFPFLSQILDNLDYDDCDSITVKRATRELMDYTPRYRGSTGSLVGIDNGEQFSFVLLDKSIIYNAVETDGYITHNEAYRDNQDWNGETVLEAIHKYNASNLVFIVKLSYGYNIRDHHSQENYSITIFKPSKEFTFADLISEAKQKAKAEILAEINF